MVKLCLFSHLCSELFFSEPENTFRILRSVCCLFICVIYQWEVSDCIREVETRRVLQSFPVHISKSIHSENWCTHTRHERMGEKVGKDTEKCSFRKTRVSSCCWWCSSNRRGKKWKLAILTSAKVFLYFTP